MRIVRRLNVEQSERLIEEMLEEAKPKERPPTDPLVRDVTVFEHREQRDRHNAPLRYRGERRKSRPRNT